MVDANVPLSDAGGSPDVTVNIGFAQAGRYQLVLWKPDRTKIVIGGEEDIARPGATHRYSLVLTPAELRGRRLVCTYELYPPAAGPNQPYYTRLDFFQNNQLINPTPPNGTEKKDKFGPEGRAVFFTICEFV